MCAYAHCWNSIVSFLLWDKLLYRLLQSPRCHVSNKTKSRWSYTTLIYCCALDRCCCFCVMHLLKLWQRIYIAWAMPLWDKTKRILQQTSVIVFCTFFFSASMLHNRWNPTQNLVCCFYSRLFYSRIDYKKLVS